MRRLLTTVMLSLTMRSITFQSSEFEFQEYAKLRLYFSIGPLSVDITDRTFTGIIIGRI